MKINLNKKEFKLYFMFDGEKYGLRCNESDFMRCWQVLINSRRKLVSQSCRYDFEGLELSLKSTKFVTHDEPFKFDVGKIYQVKDIGQFHSELSEIKIVCTASTMTVDNALPQIIVEEVEQ